MDKSKKFLKWIKPYDIIIWLIIIFIAQGLRNTPIKEAEGIYLNKPINTIEDILVESNKLMESTYKNKNYHLMNIRIELGDVLNGEVQKSVYVMYDLNNSIQGTNIVNMVFDMNESNLIRSFISKDKNKFSEIEHIDELKVLDINEIIDDMVKEYGIDKLRDLEKQEYPFMRLSIFQNHIYCNLGYTSELSKDKERSEFIQLDHEFLVNIDTIVE